MFQNLVLVTDEVSCLLNLKFLRGPALNVLGHIVMNIMSNCYNIASEKVNSKNFLTSFSFCHRFLDVLVFYF